LSDHRRSLSDVAPRPRSFLQHSPTTSRVDATALRRYISSYLSQAHRDNIDHGYPVAGFAAMLPAWPPQHSRISPADWTTRSRSWLGCSPRVDRWPRQASVGHYANGQSAYIAKWLGALVLSRSVAQAAPALSNEILENIQQDVIASLNLLSSRTSNKGKKKQGGPVR
jgi:TetR/AcrR family transcriptional repressor of nem operon